MKRYILILLALVVCVAGFNADAKKKRRTYKRATKKTIVQPEPKGFESLEGDYDGVMEYDNAKYPPEYPGGNEGLMKFLSENIKYPKSAEKNGVQGTVVLQFVVEKSGAISNVKVVKSVDKALDNEAVRVVKRMKHFIPGYDQDHAAVRVLYTLPVKFILE
ncbi:MAG: energy transducer TonB [Muribaculaceae bacterium]|nr:energy transducer TonB [Muribaculaceae bacterium]